MQAKEVLPLKRSEYLARRRRARVAVMMLFALIMGFVSAAPPVVTGCQAQDLTPVPDTSVLSPAISVPVQAAPAAPVLPEKWVCLTFDDGPSKTTPDVLNALNAAGVHATFFVVAATTKSICPCSPKRSAPDIRSHCTLLPTSTAISTAAAKPTGRTLHC